MRNEALLPQPLPAGLQRSSPVAGGRARATSRKTLSSTPEPRSRVNLVSHLPPNRFANRIELRGEATNRPTTVALPAAVWHPRPTANITVPGHDGLVESVGTTSRSSTGRGNRPSAAVSRSTCCPGATTPTAPTDVVWSRGVKGAAAPTEHGETPPGSVP